MHEYVSIGRNSVGRSVRIPVKAKSITKRWNSSGVFFLILFIIKYYPYFFNGEEQTFVRYNLFKKTSYEWRWQFPHYSNIKMKYQYCSNIPFIMFWTDIARFLEYFWNLSNSFINILAILQDFNEIYLKYFLNITVLCGLKLMLQIIKEWKGFNPLIWISVYFLLTMKNSVQLRTN